MVNLKSKTDNELKSLIRKSEKAKKIVRKKYLSVSDEFWKYKIAYRILRETVSFAQIELGKRHGLKCPALKENKSEYGYHYISCHARKGFPKSWGLNPFYKQFCSTCRLNHSQARTKMVFMKIAGGNGK